MKDLLGLSPEIADPEYLSRLHQYLRALPTIQWQEATVGGVTVATFLLWKRVPVRIPGYLVTMLLGTGVALVFNQTSALPDVDTIAT